MVLGAGGGDVNSRRSSSSCSGVGAFERAPRGQELVLAAEQQHELCLGALGAVDGRDRDPVVLASADLLGVQAGGVLEEPRQRRAGADLFGERLAARHSERRCSSTCSPSRRSSGRGERSRRCSWCSTSPPSSVTVATTTCLIERPARYALSSVSTGVGWTTRWQVGGGLNAEDPTVCRAFCDAPKRTRTSTRLSRTRPSTWRVYQFRHRREGTASIALDWLQGLSPSAGVGTLYEHTFDEVRRPRSAWTSGRI